MNWGIDHTVAIEDPFYTTPQEDVTLRLEPGDLLAEGTTPLLPTSILTRMDTKTPVSIDAPTISGTELRQRIRNLLGGVTYTLRVSFTTAGNIRSLTLHIVVER
jgi:hypothetical protein